MLSYRFRAQEIADAKGYDYPDVRMYILANVKHVLSKFELHIIEDLLHPSTSGGKLIYRRLTLDIRSGEKGWCRV